MIGRRGGRGSATELERCYRRWLLAYPAEYRRERGDELVGTLLDLAGPERTRPRPLDIVDLLRVGLACRFGNRCRHPRRGRTLAAVTFLLAAVTTLVSPLASPSRWIALTPIDLMAMLGLVLVSAIPVLVRRWWAVLPATATITLTVMLALPRFGVFFIPVVVLSWLGAVCLRHEGRRAPGVTAR